jgi:hypothetical protein
MNSESNLGRVDVLWQQAFYILTGLGQRQFFKYMPQVSIGLKATGFGGFDQGGLVCPANPLT